MRALLDRFGEWRLRRRGHPLTGDDLDLMQRQAIERAWQAWERQRDEARRREARHSPGARRHADARPIAERVEPARH